jgi:hypothetical protein
MNKNSRRNVLKGLAAGAPIIWVKPAVESMVLPAHARSSCGEFRPYNESADSDIYKSCILASTDSEQFEECMLSNCIEGGFNTPCF